MAPKELPPLTEEGVRTAKIVRRTGYAFLFTASTLLFFPMIIFAGIGVRDGQVWDPYTGKKYEAQEKNEWCRAEADRLVTLAESQERLVPIWTEPARAFIAKCRKLHPEGYGAVVATRAELKRRGKAAKGKKP